MPHPVLDLVQGRASLDVLLRLSEDARQVVGVDPLLPPLGGVRHLPGREADEIAEPERPVHPVRPHVPVVNEPRHRFGREPVALLARLQRGHGPLFAVDVGDDGDRGENLVVLVAERHRRHARPHRCSVGAVEQELLPRPDMLAAQRPRSRIVLRRDAGAPGVVALPERRSVALARGDDAGDVAPEGFVRLDRVAFAIDERDLHGQAARMAASLRASAREAAPARLRPLMSCTGAGEAHRLPVVELDRAPGRDPALATVRAADDAMLDGVTALARRVERLADRVLGGHAVVGVQPAQKPLVGDALLCTDAPQRAHALVPHEGAARNVVLVDPEAGRLQREPQPPGPVHVGGSGGDPRFRVCAVQRIGHHSTLPAVPATLHGARRACIGAALLDKGDPEAAAVPAPIERTDKASDRIRSPGSSRRARGRRARPRSKPLMLACLQQPLQASHFASRMLLTRSAPPRPA